MKKQIKKQAIERGHYLSTFSSVNYGESIYHTASCRVCGSKVLIQDGKIQYGYLLDNDCKG